MRKKVVFLLGPTGVGKTALSINIAKTYDGEIISADSVQVYKGLDIGSAKITKNQMQGIVHHCINIKDPYENFNAYEFTQILNRKIDEITNKGKLPIVVGGTGLYIKSLICGYNFGGVGINETLRHSLKEIYDKDGKEKLYEMLQAKAPDIAKQTEKDNPQRLLRAVEIAYGGGSKERVKNDQIDALVFALVMDRVQLYNNINKRVDEMLERGLISEVENLKKQGLTKENQSMKAIGYKEVLSYLDGEIPYEKMVELIKQHSRNYAKRQMTFLRGMEGVIFVEKTDSSFNVIKEKIDEWR